MSISSTAERAALLALLLLEPPRLAGRRAARKQRPHVVATGADNETGLATPGGI